MSEYCAWLVSCTRRQDVPEPGLVQRRHLRERAEQEHRLSDEVVEVEGIGAAEGAGVLPEDLEEHHLLRVAQVGRARVGLDVGEFVLELGDAAGSTRDGEAERVGVQLLDDALEQRARVAGVVDREALRLADRLGLPAKDAHARRVERRDPHALRPAAEQLLDALAHLVRRLVGERDREDLARPRFPALDEPGDAPGEDARLARAGARDDEEGGAAVLGGLALLRVQPREQAFVRAAVTAAVAVPAAPGAVAGAHVALPAVEDDRHGGGHRGRRGGGVGKARHVSRHFSRRHRHRGREPG
jgi:hypothetical protein